MYYKLLVGNIPLVLDSNVQIKGKQSVDIVANNLSIDTLTPNIRYEFHARQEFHDSSNFRIISADGDILCGFYNNDILGLPYATPVKLYKCENDLEELLGQFYLEKIERTKRTEYKINAISIIGVLDTIFHKGGVYTGKTFVELIAEFFNGSVGNPANGFIPIVGGYEPCFVEERVAGFKSYGYLPYDTCRNNLHQLLFSTGVSMIRNDNSNIEFRILDDMDSKPIDKDKIYVGGSVKYDASATGVEITEHTYQHSYLEKAASVYSNTDVYSPAAAETLVTFNNPIRVDTAYCEGGLTVSEIGQNYAVVSGKGELFAIPYVHITRKLKKEMNTVVPNIKSVDNCSLISPMNSENVLERLFSFYTSAYEEKVAIVADGEKTGSRITYTNEFGETTTGFISTNEATYSSIVKNQCVLITNYQPERFGNNYNNSIQLLGTGEWTVPPYVRQSALPYIRLALIGGGNGGNGGNGGKQGRGCQTDYTGFGGGQGGEGGNGGLAGDGGKVLSLERINVRNIKSIQYTCGVGGNGGQAGTGGTKLNDEPTEGTIGENGTHTLVKLYDDANNLVNIYTTDNGFVLPSGVCDVVTGQVYALKGIDGVKGSKGGEGGAAAFGAWGYDGENLEYNGIIYTGGKGSSSFYGSIAGTQLEAYVGGGGGGGAAVGANGQDSPNAGRASANQYVWGGDGGNGATPAIIPYTNPLAYGQGGDGGHGGGGGGSGGAQNWKPVNSGTHDGFIGAGGNGVNGSKAANGCVFIYY